MQFEYSRNTSNEQVKMTIWQEGHSIAKENCVLKSHSHWSSPTLCCVIVVVNKCLSVCVCVSNVRNICKITHISRYIMMVAHSNPLSIPGHYITYILFALICIANERIMRGNVLYTALTLWWISRSSSSSSIYSGKVKQCRVLTCPHMGVDVLPLEVMGWEDGGMKRNTQNKWFIWKHRSRWGM